MPLTSGTRLDVYDITAQIGEGGMGAVFRATDTSLSRQVAIKVLPDAFAADPDRLARFEREAKTLASLNHPHIAAIYGFEKSSGLHALVMELVEGEDLSQRIAKGAIPIDEALPIAKQIAEALEAAHEQGIIHRDLKPANIKVRADGTVKVLDFGLAKAMDPPAGSSPNVSQSPTITTPAMTQAGMILGTAACMAPEQARGKAVGKRADIWAFGAVLFEMLTGKRAFEGEDIADTLGNVMKVEPNWDRCPASIPPRVVQVMRACLQKNPRQRMDSAQGVRLVLDGAFETPAPSGEASPGAPASWTRVALVGAAALILGAILAYGAMRMVTPSVPLRVTHTAITIPPDLPLSPSAVALSPDGQTLAMTAGNQIVLRRLDNTKLTPLPRTEGGSNPFFSPEGTWVGFVAIAARELRRIRVDGTSRQTIGTLSSAPLGPPVWGADDVIYFGVTGQGLFRVAAMGGAPTPLTQPRREAGEITHAGPQLLDEGRTILFTLARADGTVPALLSVASGEWRVIPGIRGVARYAPSGHLLYRQGETVFAVPMSLADGTTTGTPEALFDGVSSSFALSADGTLAYLPDSGTPDDQGRIALVSRSGTVTSVVDDNVILQAVAAGLRFSPDAGTIAADVVSARDGSNLWIYDLRRGARTRLTNEGPVNTDPRTSRDLWTLTLDGKATPLLATPAQELTPRLSPDGRWLAYESDTAGRADAYVASLPSLGSTQLVSIEGGTDPRWAGAREIVYRPGRQVVSVTVAAGETLTLGRPTVLFEVDDASNLYDVSPDGTRFLMLLRDAAPAGAAPGQVNLVLTCSSS